MQVQRLPIFSCSLLLFSFLPRRRSRVACRTFIPPPPSPARGLSPLLTHGGLSAAVKPCCCLGLATAAEQDQGSIGVGDEEERSEFIEIGYISSTHGIKGDVQVKPSTDFPELRFRKPGTRWLRTRVSGKSLISQVELTSGRVHTSHKCWIVHLDGIETVEKAKQIIGSSLLVKNGDRPELEEDEFYTPDLVGMRILMKETGELVGTVVDVVNFGGNELLRVMRASAEESSSSTAQAGPSANRLWIPFVDEIVPDVDTISREMRITPPEGLLELNLHSDSSSKKEILKLELKETKRFNYRVIAAKKKLHEMAQNNLLEALKFGNLDQRKSLESHILEINMRLFQQALQCIAKPFPRFSLPDFVGSNSTKFLDNFRISQKCLLSCTSNGNDINHGLYHKGLELLADSKIAIVFVASSATIHGDGSESDELDNVCYRKSGSKVPLIEELLLDFKRMLEMEDEIISVPLVIISTADEIRAYERFFAKNYYNFDTVKVWLLEEEKLPIVSAGENRNEAMMKSPQETIQAPVGAGGVFSLLATHKITEHLAEIGVEYVQVCSYSSHPAAASRLLSFGWFSSREADVGIKVLEDGGDEEFDMIFSMKSLTEVCDRVDELAIYNIMERHDHIQLVESEWAESRSDEPNSYRFHCPIYSPLSCCSPDKICIMHISE